MPSMIPARRILLEDVLDLFFVNFTDAGDVVVLADALENKNKKEIRNNALRQEPPLQRH